MGKRFDAVIRGASECSKKGFANLMAIMSAYCWQLFGLFNVSLGMQSRMPIINFVPTLQLVLFNVPVFMVIWRWMVNATMKKRRGYLKMKGVTFLVIFLMTFFMGFLIKNKEIGVFFWIFSVVFSVIISTIICRSFLKEKRPHGQVSDAEESAPEEGMDH